MLNSKLLSFFTDGWTVPADGGASSQDAGASGGDSGSAAMQEMDAILQELQVQLGDGESGSSDTVDSMTHQDLAQGAADTIKSNPLLASLAETVFEVDPATPQTPIEQLLDVKEEFADFAAGPEALVALVLKMLAKRGIDRKDLLADLQAHRARLSQEQHSFTEEAMPTLRQREEEAEQAITNAQASIKEKKRQAAKVVSDAEAEAERLVAEAKNRSASMLEEASELEAGMDGLQHDLKMRQVDTVNTTQHFQAACRLMIARIDEIDTAFELSEAGG